MCLMMNAEMKKPSSLPSPKLPPCTNIRESNRARNPYRVKSSSPHGTSSKREGPPMMEQRIYENPDAVAFPVVSSFFVDLAVVVSV